MSQYMKGYRDGFRTAQLENAEQVYESKCYRLESDLARMAALVLRRYPGRCRREMRDYVEMTRYLEGFREGYARARSESKDAPDR